MTKPYQSFAQVYDRFMVDIPVHDWVDFIESLWKQDKSKPELILDMGCGTGAISLPLARKGYNIIGVDISEDMLTVARQKAAKAELDILFLQQDMRSFELYGTVDSVICICDIINYLNNIDELHQFFGLVYNYLNPGSSFVFDISTEYKYREVLADSIFCDIDDCAAYIWENSYIPERRINEYHVTFFIENEAGKYDRIEEFHSLKAFSIADIMSALELSGFSNIEIYDADGFGVVTTKSERVFFSSRKMRDSELFKHVNGAVI